MKRGAFVTVVAAMAFATVLVGARPAVAVHLFPLTPNADPLGHDCKKALGTKPPASAATVRVAGFMFSDAATNSSTTTIDAGRSVTWTWAVDHCHSVTFADGSGTRGGPGFVPANQEQLVRFNGAGNDSFTMTFPTAGTFAYTCVHHASVGMTGTVVVRAVAPPSGGGGGGGGGSGSSPSPAAPDAATPPPTLPVTGTSTNHMELLATALLAGAFVTHRVLVRSAARSRRAAGALSRTARVWCLSPKWRVPTSV